MKSRKVQVKICAAKVGESEIRSRQLRGNDKKTVRREGIEPIKRVFAYVLFSITHFIKNMVQNSIFG